MGFRREIFVIGEQRIYYFFKVELYFKKCNYFIYKNLDCYYNNNKAKKKEKNVFILYCNKFIEVLSEYIFIKLFLIIRMI